MKETPCSVFQRNRSGIKAHLTGCKKMSCKGKGGKAGDHFSWVVTRTWVRFEDSLSADYIIWKVESLFAEQIEATVIPPPSCSFCSASLHPLPLLGYSLVARTYTRPMCSRWHRHHAFNMQCHQHAFPWENLHIIHSKNLTAQARSKPTRNFNGCTLSSRLQPLVAKPSGAKGN